MNITIQNALLRALSFCAKIFHTARTGAKPIGSTALPLDPHMVRDVGLSPSEIERIRHRWPSQSTQHPYL